MVAESFVLTFSTLSNAGGALSAAQANRYVRLRREGPRFLGTIEAGFRQQQCSNLGFVTTLADVMEALQKGG